MKSPDCLAILAILAEMVKRVNENIAKIDLKSLSVGLDVSGAVKRTVVRRAKKA